MTTFVISAFPGCGKTHCFKNLNGKGLSILDSDSSEFSWIKDKDGNNTKERNPEFPSNYIKHIKDNIDKVDIIFVSSHEVVRNALIESKISFILIYPYKHCKGEWIERFKSRGNNEAFINFISNNWDSFIEDMDSIDENIGKQSVGGLIYSKIHKHRLDQGKYIDANYLYGLIDNSMGNLCCLWGN